MNSFVQVNLQAHTRLTSFYLLLTIGSYHEQNKKNKTQLGKCYSNIVKIRLYFEIPHGHDCVAVSIPAQLLSKQCFLFIL